MPGHQPLSQRDLAFLLQRYRQNSIAQGVDPRKQRNAPDSHPSAVESEGGSRPEFWPHKWHNSDSASVPASPASSESHTPTVPPPLAPQHTEAAETAQDHQTFTPTSGTGKTAEHRRGQKDPAHASPSPERQLHPFTGDIKHSTTHTKASNEQRDRNISSPHLHSNTASPSPTSLSSSLARPSQSSCTPASSSVSRHNLPSSKAAPAPEIKTDSSSAKVLTASEGPANDTVIGIIPSGKSLATIFASEPTSSGSRKFPTPPSEILAPSRPSSSDPSLRPLEIEGASSLATPPPRTKSPAPLLPSSLARTVELLCSTHIEAHKLGIATQREEQRVQMEAMLSRRFDEHIETSRKKFDRQLNQNRIEIESRISDLQKQMAEQILTTQTSIQEELENFAVACLQDAAETRAELVTSSQRSLEHSLQADIGKKFAVAETRMKTTLSTSVDTLQAKFDALLDALQTVGGGDASGSEHTLPEQNGNSLQESIVVDEDAVDTQCSSATQRTGPSDDVLGPSKDNSASSAYTPELTPDVSDRSEIPPSRVSTESAMKQLPTSSQSSQSSQRESPSTEAEQAEQQSHRPVQVSEQVDTASALEKAQLAEPVREESNANEAGDKHSTQIQPANTIPISPSKSAPPELLPTTAPAKIGPSKLQSSPSCPPLPPSPASSTGQPGSPPCPVAVAAAGTGSDLPQTLSKKGRKSRNKTEPGNSPSSQTPSSPTRPDARSDAVGKRQRKDTAPEASSNKANFCKSPADQTPPSPARSEGSGKRHREDAGHEVPPTDTVQKRQKVVPWRQILSGDFRTKAVSEPRAAVATLCRPRGLEIVGRSSKGSDPSTNAQTVSEGGKSVLSYGYLVTPHVPSDGVRHVSPFWESGDYWQAGDPLPTPLYEMSPLSQSEDSYLAIEARRRQGLTRSTNTLSSRFSLTSRPRPHTSEHQEIEPSHDIVSNSSYRHETPEPVDLGSSDDDVANMTKKPHLSIRGAAASEDIARNGGSDTLLRRISAV
ncbi:unnamed protein product [Sympodiomycopsis kandeliae]